MPKAKRSLGPRNSKLTKTNSKIGNPNRSKNPKQIYSPATILLISLFSDFSQIRKLIATTTLIFFCFTLLSSNYVQEQIYVRRYGRAPPPPPEFQGYYGAPPAGIPGQEAAAPAAAADPSMQINKSYINDLVKNQDQAGMVNAINALAEENQQEYNSIEENGQSDTVNSVDYPRAPAESGLPVVENPPPAGEIAEAISKLPDVGQVAEVAVELNPAAPIQVQVQPQAPAAPVAQAAPAAPVAQAAPAAEHKNTAAQNFNQALNAARANPSGQPAAPGAIEKLLGIPSGSSIGKFKDELAQNLIDVPEKPEVPYNPQFIFHTKLPKAGSTTMNNILKALSVKNMFFFAKINPHMLGTGDSLRAEDPLVKWYNKTFENTIAPTSRYNNRMVLLKHHYPFDFTKYGIANPTYINVLREPASWFQSHYYFERYGWQQDSGDRNSFSGSIEDRDRTINECIEAEHSDCKIPKWTYFEYVCGGNCPRSKALRKAGHTDLSKIAEESKKSLMNRFYVVGILEDFDRSLQLFEKMMPEVFNGVLGVAHSYAIQSVQNSTKSLHVTKMTEENANALRSRALKYESDFYQFAKAIFYQQVRKYGLMP